MKNTTKRKKKDSGSILDNLIEKQSSQTARDMKDWRDAKREATRIDFPKRVRISDLLEDLLYDTFLSSQMELRRDRNLAESFQILDRNGKLVEEGTKILQDSIQFAEILKYLYETPFFGHSLLELLPAKNKDICEVKLIPRRHIIPSLGAILLDVSDTKLLFYRQLASYGSSLIELGDQKDLGILFDCAPATIYRRYAWASWSEFCEIYGIPPRILKMDTMDDVAFHNAKVMMQKMGAANWAIIDHTEEMSFANGLSDNGNIFYSLIQAAKEDVSIKICGAQIGQDTRNGNRSKEEVSLSVLDSKCLSDRKHGKKVLNSTILPALSSLGILPEGCIFSYPNDDEEDNGELWDRTLSILPYYNIPASWIKEKFKIEVEEKKEIPQLKSKLSANREESSDFF